MRFRQVMLLAAAMAAAPLAQAQGQVSCSDVSETLEAAFFDFEDVIGEEVDEYVFDSELVMPGADACTLQLDWDSVLFCLWTHDTEASARAAYDQLTVTVGNCLAGWKPESLMEEPPVPETAIAYNIRSGEGDFADMEVMLHLDRHEEGGVVVYEVWYELAYYLF